MDYINTTQGIIYKDDIPLVRKEQELSITTKLAVFASIIIIILLFICNITLGYMKRNDSNEYAKKDSFLSDYVATDVTHKTLHDVKELYLFNNYYDLPIETVILIQHNREVLNIPIFNHNFVEKLPINKGSSYKITIPYSIQVDEIVLKFNTYDSLSVVNGEFKNINSVNVIIKDSYNNINWKNAHRIFPQQYNSIVF